MKYPMPEQILFLHTRLISETGGSHGVRDLGLLVSAVGGHQATFEGSELDLPPENWSTNELGLGFSGGRSGADRQ